MNNAAQRKKHLSGLFVQFLGFLVCVGLPAFVTAIAPVCVTHFDRIGDRGIAHTSWNMFFAIPYRRDIVDPVTSVDDRFNAGTYSRRRTGDRHQTKSEDESFLVIHGPNQEAEVYVSPVNTEATLAKAQAFLKDPGQSSLRLITVANWKFSVIFSIPLVLLAALYVVGVLISFVRLVLGLSKRS